MTATPFQTEAWTEYGIGVLVLLLRYFARWRAVGFKGWQGDDWFAVGALVFWTAELVMLELIGQNGTNIGITDEMGAKLTDAEIAKLEFGSKCLLAGWNFYVSLIWCLKGSILCFYHRMTLGLKQQKVVKWTQLATILAFVGVLAVIWGHCTPVQKNWQVYPNPGDKCTLAVANYVALVVLNISTDFVIVCIPLPLLWKVKLSIQRKLIIGLLLCSGVFIMIATLLRCVLSLRDITGINTSTIWAIRETFVGIIAVNAAAIKPLFSASRWLISSKGSSKDKSSGYANRYGYPLGSVNAVNPGHSLTSSRHHQKKMMTELGDNSSEEHIVTKVEYNPYKNDIRAGSTASNNSGPDGIMVTKTYEVSPAKSTLDV
ncbi:Fc.00g039390.m01.CDS01 [Cosmosporella sp. VM-42]